MPRTSPPASSAASSAPSIRAARSPRVDSKARAIAGQTASERIRLACTLYCGPTSPPATGMFREPVCTATRPAASIIATCRTWLSGSCRSRNASASGAGIRERMSMSPRGPSYDGSMNDWVATAPTPGSAQATTLPTLNQCDCTATPSSPVAESRATIE